MKEAANDLQNEITFLSNKFDYRKGCIIKFSGQEIFLEPRLKELFYILLCHKNDFITREDLMKFVWKDTIVSEQSVTKAISDLRKFLVKNHFEKLKIVTVSKLGYKLTVPDYEKKPYNKRIFTISIYTIGIIIALIIIIRALRYNQ